MSSRTSLAKNQNACKRGGVHIRDIVANAHQFTATTRWPADAANTHPDATYSRDAQLGSGDDSGRKPAVPGSAPTVFGGDATRYNPEELLLMSLSECHMLTFLAIASRKGVRVVSYEDDAIGTLAIGEYGTKGKMSMQEAVLRPRVSIVGASAEDVQAMHEKAHANCFIANSVNFPVRFEAQTTVA